MKFELTSEDVRKYPWGIEPQEGFRYIGISSWCPECAEAGYVLPGHFACWPEVIPANGRVVARVLDGGWKALVEIPEEEENRIWLARCHTETMYLYAVVVASSAEEAEGLVAEQYGLAKEDVYVYEKGVQFLNKKGVLLDSEWWFWE